VALLPSLVVAEEQPAADAAASDRYILYKQLPLTGQISGIVQMQCSTTCSTQRASRDLTGAGGTVEVWQDSRITQAMRAKLWGKAGGAIAFGGKPAKNAIIRLKDASGATLTQAPLDKPLVDLDPLLLGGSKPVYLISIDYHAGTVDSAMIVRGILNVDVEQRQMSFATFVGPKTAPVKFPDGQRGDMAVPGAETILTFDTSFVLRTNVADHTAVLDMTRCTAGSYVDYKTREPITAPLTVHTIYEFRDAAWQRRADLVFNHCGGSITSATTRVQSRN
jgi:hypothetical protein